MHILYFSLPFFYNKYIYASSVCSPDIVPLFPGCKGITPKKRPAEIKYKQIWWVQGKGIEEQCKRGVKEHWGGIDGGLPLMGACNRAHVQRVIGRVCQTNGRGMRGQVRVWWWKGRCSPYMGSINSYILYTHFNTIHILSFFWNQ